MPPKKPCHIVEIEITPHIEATIHARYKIPWLVAGVSKEHRT